MLISTDFPDFQSPLFFFIKKKNNKKKAYLRVETEIWCFFKKIKRFGNKKYCCSLGGGSLCQVHTLIQSEILNPQPSIRNPQSSILNPQSSTLNPQSAILNPQSSIPNPQSSILNPQFSIRNPQSSIRNSQSSILNQKASLQITPPPPRPLLFSGTKRRKIF